MEQNAPTPSSLTERELEILKLVATGATNQQIALDLFISSNTVKVHLRNIFQKLGVESRTEATMYAVRAGWVMPVPAASEDAKPEQLVMPRLRIPTWQRVALVSLTIVTAALALSTPSPKASERANNPFTDTAAGTVGDAIGTSISRWETRAQMPTARARLAVVALKGRIYAIGGDSVDGVSGAVEIYDPASDTWIRGAPKPRPVLNIGAAALNDLIYVPGGYGALEQASAEVEVYDPARDTWTEVASLPEPLFAYGIAAYDGKLYVLGGYNGIRYVDSVYIYDPALNTWSSGTPMRKPRGFCAAAVTDRGIYLLGGFDGQTESASFELYEPEKEGTREHPWTALTPMLEERGGLAAVSVDSYLYAIGGGWSTELLNNERYSLALGSWSPLDSPVLGEWRTLGAATLSTQSETAIFAIGGWNDRPLSTNYMFKAAFRIYLPGG